MRSIGRLVTVPAAVLAIALYWARLRPEAPPQPLAIAPISPAHEPSGGREPTDVRVATVEPGAGPADAEDRVLDAALASPSETVRDGTLLTAIRREGFVCSEVLGAVPFGAETPGWRVSCADAFAYSVVRSPDGLVAEPIYEGSPPFSATPRPMPLERRGVPAGPTR